MLDDIVIGDIRGRFEILNKLIDDIVIGDIHGHFELLNKLIDMFKPKRIHSVGDFGWWPKFDGCPMYNELTNTKYIWQQYNRLDAKDTKIYFCPGNHEDWSDLLTKQDNEELLPNVFYKPRGSYITLPDGRNILYIGGADSIDKNSRIIGVDWFPEEIISYRDICNLPDIDVDIVISHTAPKSFGTIIENENINRDPCRIALDVVLEKYRPKLWYFGHYHTYCTGSFQGTKWICLSAVSSKHWREYLQ